MTISNHDLLLSFILPVYNVEAYLRECIDSILEQITPACEIILVNDGSTDLSGKICDEYAAQWACVKVIHKENGGQASARNTGILAAGGKYITFVDSDDRIAAGSIETILSWIRCHGADLCFLQADKFFPDGSQISLGEDIHSTALHGKNRINAIEYLSTRPKFPGGPWAKLYRREYMADNQLFFPVDCRFAEDLGFVRDCILCAQSFDAIDVPYYEYRQNRQGSVTNRITARTFFDLLRFVADSAKMLTVDKTPKDDVSRFMMRFAAYEYSVLLYQYRSIPAQEKKKAFEKLKEYRWVLQYASGARERMVSGSCRLFGIAFTSWLLNLYRNLSV